MSRRSSAQFIAAGWLAALVLTPAALGQAPWIVGAAAAPTQPAGVPHPAAGFRWPLQINAGDTTLTLYQPQRSNCREGGRRKDKPQSQFGPSMPAPCRTRDGARCRSIRRRLPGQTSSTSAQQSNA